MRNLTKALVGTVAAGAMAVSTATPAFARDHNDGIDAGDVIAGALVIGGIAAIAAAASNNDRNDYRYRNGYRYDRAGYRYGYRIDPRRAVSLCVAAAERNASRYGYGRRAHVTDIRKVRENRRGYRVEGRISVDTDGRQWRRGNRGYDRGRFKCQIRDGRVVDIDYSGIRGLR